MAKPVGNTFGKFNGKLGNKVHRKLYGKQSVSERPPTYNKSMSAGAFKTHMRTKLNNKLAKAIKSDDILYDLWDKSKSLGANKNSRILKTNATITTYEGLNLRNTITPVYKYVPDRFHPYIHFLKMKSLSLKRKSLIAEFNLSQDIVLSPEKPLHCVFMVYLSRNDIFTSDDFVVLKFFGDVNINQSDEFTKCKVKVDNESLELIDSFAKGIIYFAVVRFNESIKRYEWSNTVSKEI